MAVTYSTIQGPAKSHPELPGAFGGALVQGPWAGGVSTYPIGPSVGALWSPGIIVVHGRTVGAVVLGAQLAHGLTWTCTFGVTFLAGSRAEAFLGAGLA